MGEDVRSETSREAVSSGPMRLALLDGGHVRSVFALTPERQVIGRDASCSIVLPDRRASKHHAEVCFANDRFVVRDLASSNGTRVNEYRVRSQDLFPGDLVRVGRSMLLCLTDAMPIPRIPAKAVGWLRVRLPDGREDMVPVTSTPALVGGAAECEIRLRMHNVPDFQGHFVAIPCGVQYTDLTGPVPRCEFVSERWRIIVGQAEIGFVNTGFQAETREPPTDHAAAAAPSGDTASDRPAADPGADADRPEESLTESLMAEAEHAETVAGDSGAPRKAKAGYRSGMCSLTATRGPHSGVHFTIGRKPFHIGADSECDVVLQDKNVSDRHARIYHLEGDVVVEVLGPHPLYVNETRVRKRPLRPGDRVRIGNSEFFVHL